MKHEKSLTFLAAAILGSLLGAGVLGCLVTAFDLPVTNLTRLLLCCAGIVTVSAVLFSFRYGGIVFLWLSGIGLVFLWRETDLRPQLWNIINTLLTLYDRAYGLGLDVISQAEAATVALPLLLLGSAAGAAGAWCQCRRGSSWLPWLASLIPLSLCIVVTDTVPAEVFLYPVLLVLLTYLVAGLARQENSSQGLHLTAAVLLPLALGLAALFLTIPQSTYVNRSAAIREDILTAARNLPHMLEEGAKTAATHLRGAEPQQLDLENVGKRIPFAYPAMEVTSDVSGTLYLRGRDYDRYDGLGWTSSPDRRETFFAPGDTAGTVTICTSPGKELRYLPYYPSEETVLTGGMANNPESREEYTISRSRLPENWRITAYTAADPVNALPKEERQQYLSLPDHTRAGAEEILAQLPVMGSATEKADTIAAFVTDCAIYDLNTEKMPAGEPDFALWFLTSAEKGYCIHFATAATVLLRAADIPARYVTGYLAEVTSGKTVTLTEENAHAWAEYYEPLLGAWVPLEATPAASAPPDASGTTTPVSSTESTELPEPSSETEQTQREETAPSSAPETQTVPPESSEPGAEPQAIPSALGKRLKEIALALLAGILLVFQRSFRLKLRRRRMRTGSLNRQALARWQEAERLSRLLKESPTEELMVLAQKAKFSQHEITQQELALFDSFHRSCLRRLREKSWYLQLIYQYVYAVY